MIKFIQLTTLTVIAGFLVGCLYAPFSIPYDENNETVQYIDNPPIGVEATALVGEYLVEKRTVTESHVLQVLEPIDARYDIPAGTYRRIGGDTESDFYSAFGVEEADFTIPPEALRLGKTEGAELCIVTMHTDSAACYSGRYQRDTVVSEAETNFQQTLIYNGRVGDQLHIGYREFSGGLARDAFSNSIEYDLSVSNTIGYRDAVIEVIEADNSRIVYRLISNFR